jgi:glyoxylase-like metal-dependent hydrolase (beta-lactamase superfamily II)
MVAMLWALGLLSSSPQPPLVNVEKLADNVYLFTCNVHRSLFVVTEEAVLVTDPQSAEAAQRFLEEIRKVSTAPIRYLVYSHHHDDHASGGKVFGDAAIVAHSKVLGHIQADIVAPDLTFDDRASIYLGDLEVRLVYPGPSETESNLIVHIPARKVAFMVDSVFVRALPWRNMAGADPRAWIAALEKLDALDFDILAPGHGPTGKKEDVRVFIGYLKDLMAAVEARMKAGESLQKIQETLELPKYRDWARYGEHFDLNIEGVYRELGK